MRKNNQKGFTLMEMLIVVAVIAILVAIAIPVFTGSFTKAKEAADHANLRAAFAKASEQYLSGDEGSADTPPMQADGELTIDETKFTWNEKEIVTVIVDEDGLRKGEP